MNGLPHRPAPSCIAIPLDTISIDVTSDRQTEPGSVYARWLGESTTDMDFGTAISERLERSGARNRVATALRLWGLAFAFLVPVALVAVLVLWIGRQHTPRPFRPFEAVLLFVDWSIWATLAPLIIGLVWRWPLSRGRWIKGLSTHLVIGGVVALGEMALFVVIARLLGGYPQQTFAQGYWVVLAIWYPYALLVYWLIAIATQAVMASKQSQARALEAAVLQEQLTAAQLNALRMQLHPHFLCNTLNTIAVLLRDGRTEDAGDIVTGLGALLHTALERMDAHEVPLREGIEFVARYLEIERVRFSDRMAVTIDTDGADLDALVPCMILQPVVENAVRHGLSRDPTAGRVTVRAATDDGRLALTVEDDGPGFGAASRSNGNGVGLVNTRARLARLYDSAAELRVANRPGGGAIVEISLPLYKEPRVTAAPATVLA